MMKELKKMRMDIKVKGQRTCKRNVEVALVDFLKTEYSLKKESKGKFVSLTYVNESPKLFRGICRQVGSKFERGEGRPGMSPRSYILPNAYVHSLNSLGFQI